MTAFYDVNQHDDEASLATAVHGRRPPRLGGRMGPSEFRLRSHFTRHRHGRTELCPTLPAFPNVRRTATSTTNAVHALDVPISAKSKCESCSRLSPATWRWRDVRIRDGCTFGLWWRLRCTRHHILSTPFDEHTATRKSSRNITRSASRTVTIVFPIESTQVRADEQWYSTPSCELAQDG